MQYKYKTVWASVNETLVTGHYDRGGRFVDVRPVGWASFEWLPAGSGSYTARIHPSKGVACNALRLNDGIAVAVRRDADNLFVTVCFVVHQDGETFTVLMEKDAWISNSEREMLAAKFPLTASIFAARDAERAATSARWKMEYDERKREQEAARATMRDDFERMIEDAPARKVIARWVRTQRNRQQVDEILRPLQGKYGLYTDDLRAALTDQFREKFTV